MAGGRPTKYRKEFCKIAEDTLAEGFSIAVVAANLDVCRDTIYEWASNHDSFSDSIKKGKAKGQAYYEKLLKAKVTGQKVKNFDPKLSDTACLIFALKTRFHKDFGNKDKLEVAQTADISISIDEDDNGL